MNTASNHSIYAQWTANTYTVTFNRTNFGNGEVVYFNPVTAKVCDASEAVSTTGTKTGCMKWYAFLDDGSDTIRLLLDHNTTATVAWNTDSTGTTPDTALAQLSSDVFSWNSTIKSTARLITAQEVNQIAPTTTSFNWIETNKYTWYYLHNGNQTLYTGAAGSNTYAWLFDNTYDCTTYGCNTADSSTEGYWTSTYVTDGRGWRVSSIGTLFYIYAAAGDGLFGIRPVIEIDKSLLQKTKEVTYDNTYGQLPTLSRHGYTFNGWYTTGGIRIESTSKVSLSNNHILYPQWFANTTDFTYTGSSQEYVVPISGTYKIELWGAQGGDIESGVEYNIGGTASYTSGIINLTSNTKLYLYVGKSGSINEQKQTFNGGGAAATNDNYCASGGGATDIRLINGSWDNGTSLASRIMVAAGGAGAERYYAPGTGGGLISFSDRYIDDIATQFSGYEFGIGSNAKGGANASGAGGGYYGGKVANGYTGGDMTLSSAGGSSYISGHIGSVAISSSSSTNPRNDSNNVSCGSTSSIGYNSDGYNTDYTCSIHYSGYTFTNTAMIDGAGYDWTITNGLLSKTLTKMPKPNGEYYSSGIGHEGNGYARITYLER